MKRLTSDKPVAEMGVFELAYNSCYIKDGKARYRDYSLDEDARVLTRMLFKDHADGDDAFSCDEDFDDWMAYYLQDGMDSTEGLIALFYRNLLAMADLRERLKYYEDLEEQGKLLIVPQIPKNKTLYWIWGEEIMPVTYKRITSCVVDDCGNPHIMCEMRTKKDRTFIHTYKRKITETAFKAGDKRYFYSEDIGKTIFFTREKAEAALKEMQEVQHEDMS